MILIRRANAREHARKSRENVRKTGQNVVKVDKQGRESGQSGRLPSLLISYEKQRKVRLGSVVVQTVGCGQFAGS